VHVIGHEVASRDPALAPLRKLTEAWAALIVDVSLKLDPSSRRSWPKGVLRRYFGMRTTWSLQSHFVWFRLSYSSIWKPLRALGRLTKGDPLWGHSRNRQTSERAGYPVHPGGIIAGVNDRERLDRLPGTCSKGAMRVPTISRIRTWLLAWIGCGPQLTPRKQAGEIAAVVVDALYILAPARPDVTDVLGYRVRVKRRNPSTRGVGCPLRGGRACGLTPRAGRASVVGMLLEGTLLEKLRRSRRCYAGTTVAGEREAARCRNRSCTPSLIARRAVQPLAERERPHR